MDLGKTIESILTALSKGAGVLSDILFGSLQNTIDLIREHFPNFAKIPIDALSALFTEEEVVKVLDYPLIYYVLGAGVLFYVCFTIVRYVIDTFL